MKLSCFINLLLVALIFVVSFVKLLLFYNGLSLAAAVGLLLLSITIVLAGNVLISYVRDRLRGYTIGSGYKILTYKEYGKGTLELVFDPCIVVPSENEWRQEMPDWAKNRRDEIMQRIVREHAGDDEPLRFKGYEN